MEPIIYGNLEPVKKEHPRYNFPTVAILMTKCGNCRCVLNKHTQQFIDKTVHVAWYKSDHYIVCLPSKAINSYSPIFQGERRTFLGYSFPKQLINDNIVKPGHYRAYNYKSGFCFEYATRLEDEKK